MGDDIHGDGINVVDRIQALAEPGGIAISGMAYDHVRAKVAVGFASLGEQTVKSNAEPIRVYRVVLDPAAAGKTTEAGKNRRSWRVPAAAAAVVIVLLLGGAVAWWQPWRTTGDLPDVRNVVVGDTRPSLVVLPFDNLSDKQQGYLADGITEVCRDKISRLAASALPFFSKRRDVDGGSCCELSPCLRVGALRTGGRMTGQTVTTILPNCSFDSRKRCASTIW
jgi:adenylate cyclase